MDIEFEGKATTVNDLADYADHHKNIHPNEVVDVKVCNIVAVLSAKIIELETENIDLKLQLNPPEPEPEIP